jgi:phenylalanyl-tRNA synthetase beta chain
MKFSTNWIAELLEDGIDTPAKELASLITTKTAEHEGIEPVGAQFERVRVARVIEAEPIPNSKNRKARIDAGPDGEKTVVCGAPNCRAGILTAWVPPGTALESRTIGVAVVSGVESSGMLASGEEIGVNRDDDGIIELTGVAPGDPLPGLRPDNIIEIDNKSLTHRPDLWGHLGMAREVSAITGKRLKDPVDLSRLPAVGDSAVRVEIEDYALCPRYSALVFENVTVQPSPLWLQYRLQAIGLNPINNIVDVTNFLLAELPQPTHAFDADTLAGDTIFVRRARTGDSLKTLNQETYTLDDQALVIADANGPVAVAGVIGGLDTGVTEKTKRIVLESANFQAASVRKTSSRLKVRTDASMRFEKAQDPHNTTRALARAIGLLELVSPGIRLVGGLIDNLGPLPPAPEIDLPLTWLRSKLGRDVSKAEVTSILEALQFTVTEPQPEILHVTVPSWRATKDISIKEDLVEEVGRMLGYISITPTAPAVPAVPPPANAERDFFHRLRAIATGQGFHEAYNYSFVNEAQVRELGLDLGAHVRVLNPIASDQDLLRTTLLCGVLRNVRDNARHLDSFRFFEIGNEIHKRSGELPDEIPHLAACVFAKAGDGSAQLLEAKRLAECLLPGATAAEGKPSPYEHPYRAYSITWRGQNVGRLFEFHPNMVDGRAAVLDLDLRAIQALGELPIKYTPLRRYPTSAFDLSVLVPLRTPVAEIQTRISTNGGAFLQSVEFVTQYQGAPLAADRKSVSFRVTLGAADRTLSSDEITQSRTSLIESLRSAGYDLRV